MPSHFYPSIDGFEQLQYPLKIVEHILVVMVYIETIEFPPHEFRDCEFQNSSPRY